MILNYSKNKYEYFFIINIDILITNLENIINFIYNYSS